jgi:hypothetical protein
MADALGAGSNTSARGIDRLRMWAGRAADRFCVDLRSSPVADVKTSIELGELRHVSSS